MAPSAFPRELRRTFSVQRATQRKTPDGRETTYADEGEPFVGVIADADTRALMVAQQAGYAFTNLVVSEGPPRAEPGTVLRCDAVAGSPGKPERWFRIEGVEDPGDMGLFSLYYCERIDPPRRTPEVPPDAP